MLYLAPVLGVGSEANPRCHISDGEGHGGIHLPGAAHSLVWIPDGSGDKRLHKLGGHRHEKMTPALRRHLSNVLGVNLSGRHGDEHADVIRDLLEAIGAPLTAGVFTLEHDAYELWLGNQLVKRWLIPATKHTQTFTETMQGSDAIDFVSGGGSVLTWTYDGGTVGMLARTAGGTPNTRYARASSQSTSTTACQARCTSNCDTSNMQISAAFEYTVVNANNREIYMWVRATHVGTGTLNGYRCRLRSNTGGYTHSMNSIVSGTNTSIASPTGDPGATGALTWKANGTSISGTFGSLGTTTVSDSGLSGGVQGGIGFANGAGVGSADENRLHANIVINDLAPTDVDAGRGLPRGMQRGIARGLVSAMEMVRDGLLWRPRETRVIVPVGIALPQGA